MTTRKRRRPRVRYASRAPPAPPQNAMNAMIAPTTIQGTRNASQSIGGRMLFDAEARGPAGRGSGAQVAASRLARFQLPKQEKTELRLGRRWSTDARCW